MAPGHLLALPNVVIHQIVDKLDPRDLGSFVLSCKTTHKICQIAIKRHQELLKEYSALRFGDPGSWHGNYWLGDHALFFLKKFLFNPRIAYYPRSIHAAQWGYDNDVDESIEEMGNLADVIASCGSKIAALGAKHLWFKEQERRDEWRDALLVPTNQYHHLAMLLTMLPNLQSITFTSMSRHSEPIRDMVRSIAAANRDPESPMHQKALAKLTRISVDRADTEMGEDITFYGPFLELPSIRSVHGRMIDGENGALAAVNSDQRPGVLLPWQVEEIDMEYSAIDLGSCDWMLRRIENLTRFSYHHAGSVVGDAEYYSGGIVALLKKHASHSLVRLDLTADSIDNYGMEMASGYVLKQFVGDLRDFRKLRVLALDDTAFQKPKDRKLVRLVDVLPASIEMVTLLSRIEEGNSAELFIGLAERKKDKVPQLKKLVLLGKISVQQGLFDELKGVGIEITGRGWEMV
ncbi:MAG: hypothetical protein Q9208_002138 [Pyrenodesmia sp. 3 TL-2023]